MVVLITDIVKMTISVADISTEPIINTPLELPQLYNTSCICKTVNEHSFYVVYIS